MNESYHQISRIVSQSDAVLIGASNGLSISEGFHLFADNMWFQTHFGDFRLKYGFRNMLQGMFYAFQTQEEYWTFWGRVIRLQCLQYQPSQMMLALYELVKDKPHFVVTSNGENHFVPSGFASEQVFELEGTFAEMRCVAGCHDEIYFTLEATNRMRELENGLLADTQVPKCPHCGGAMQINMAVDRSFFTTKRWQRKQALYQEFLHQYHGKKLVILELGVGWSNQMIKEPFMRLAASEPNATYVTFNKGEVYIPDQIAEKSIGVDGDLSAILPELLKIVQEDP